MRLLIGLDQIRYYIILFWIISIKFYKFNKITLLRLKIMVIWYGSHMTCLRLWGNVLSIFCFVKNFLSKFFSTHFFVDFFFCHTFFKKLFWWNFFSRNFSCKMVYNFKNHLKTTLRPFQDILNFFHIWTKNFGHRKLMHK